MKRFLDLVLVLFISPLVLPIVLITMALVRIKLGKDIFFNQVRPGINGRPFKMVKFRTMLDAIDKNGKPLPDSERMTRFGGILRSLSLDELPELWNVIKGDMSLVGPRPLLMKYLPLYNEEQMRRHEVPPGITGWAQINGRNAISWHEKFMFDIWYVDNHTLWLDIKILLLTIKKVLFREGISARGEATMTEFNGNTE